MLKRSFDFICALVLLLLLSPILLVFSLLILKRMGKPVFFKQARPGLNGNIFYMYKFRSMINAMNDEGVQLSDEERITHLGSFIRNYSIDELPGICNVLKGDMSFVGPRPLLVQYLSRYSPMQARRHEVKPGITGWAQVNGRNAISWEKKFELDVWYVDNQSFMLDLQILLLTIKKVFMREGINAEGEATMSEFRGSKKDE
jgi:lipopolysaccharide/colanic/teichoic acid biosynthesis glycosyltransferase